MQKSPKVPTSGESASLAGCKGAWWLPAGIQVVHHPPAFRPFQLITAFPPNKAQLLRPLRAEAGVYPNCTPKSIYGCNRRRVPFRPGMTRHRRERNGQRHGFFKRYYIQRTNNYKRAITRVVGGAGRHRLDRGVCNCGDANTFTFIHTRVFQRPTREGQTSFPFRMDTFVQRSAVCRVRSTTPRSSECYKPLVQADQVRDLFCNLRLDGRLVPYRAENSDMATATGAVGYYG